MTQQLKSTTPSRPQKLDLPKMTYEQFLEWEFEDPRSPVLKGFWLRAERLWQRPKLKAALAELGL